MNSMYFWPNNTNRICAVDTQVKAYFLYVRFHLKWKIHASQDLYSFVQFITKDMAVATKKIITIIIGQQKDWNIPFFILEIEVQKKMAIKWNLASFSFYCVSLDDKKYTYMSDMKKTIVLNFCISMWHVCFIFPFYLCKNVLYFNRPRSGFISSGYYSF